MIPLSASAGTKSVSPAGVLPVLPPETESADDTSFSALLDKPSESPPAENEHPEIPNPLWLVLPPPDQTASHRFVDARPPPPDRSETQDSTASDSDPGVQLDREDQVSDRADLPRASAEPKMETPAAVVPTPPLLQLTGRQSPLPAAPVPLTSIPHLPMPAANSERQELPVPGGKADPTSEPIEPVTQKQPKNHPLIGSIGPLGDSENAGMPHAQAVVPMLTQTPIESQIAPPTPVVVDAISELAELRFNPMFERPAANVILEDGFAEGDFLHSGFDGFHESSSEERIEALSPSPARVRLAVRETILNHGLQLRDLGRSHLDITFRPDKKSRISLHLQVINGEIVVEASLEQGNPELAADWIRLQRSLAKDGVELRDLQTSPDHGRNANANSHTDRDPRESSATDSDSRSDDQVSGNGSPEEDALNVGAPTEVPFPGVVVASDNGSTWQAWS
ncbi:MAG: hypothetical protein ACI91J_001429 [Yoonia sp.]